MYWLLLLYRCSSVAPMLRGPQAILQVYFIDVDGGQSTLFVTPAGKSLLIDTGWAGNDGLDAKRIAAAAKDAGMSKIDYVLLTHYMPTTRVACRSWCKRIPVGTFIDHGPNREPTDAPPRMLRGLSAGSGRRTLRPYRRQAGRDFADRGMKVSGDQRRWPA